MHVELARRVAAQAHRAGVEQLVHISGIGSDAASPSLYIRKRGEGELAVRAAFADATIIRPAVMFGPGDAFLTTILKLLRRLPIYPMFGRGLTRLQPAYVEDVAEAIAITVVPPNQTEAMVTALRPSGKPVGYFLFSGEQHGFRQAANIKRALDAELYFYAVEVLDTGLTF